MFGHQSDHSKLQSMRELKVKTIIGYPEFVHFLSTLVKRINTLHHSRSSKEPNNTCRLIYDIPFVGSHQTTFQLELFRNKDGVGVERNRKLLMSLLYIDLRKTLSKTLS